MPPRPLPFWIRLKEWDKAFVSTYCIKNLTLVSRINIYFPSFLALNHFWSCLKVNIKIKNNVNLWFPKLSCHNFCVKTLWSWLQKGITWGNHHEHNYYHFRDGVINYPQRDFSFTPTNKNCIFWTLVVSWLGTIESCIGSTFKQF